MAGSGRCSRSKGVAAGLYSVHVRTRKFRNPEKTKRYVVPAPTANSKTQGGTRIDSDSICHRCHRHQSVFFGFSDGLSIHLMTKELGEVRSQVAADVAALGVKSTPFFHIACMTTAILRA